ncbi:MAG: restriction endonuclease [Deltaproteobacteria bacterium]|nr:restriction endonuclease [Deltaproteobacteria bacterium]
MSANPITQNTLFYGDNLIILRDYIPDESIDLIYLDPPFNSNRTYHVLFKDESGKETDAQITAFDDTWQWNKAAEETYHNLVTDSPAGISSLIGALRQFIGSNQMMAYLVMMAVRLVELHRVLKPTGSLYLHCDPTASHYLKIVLDAILGKENFRNEIVWKRKTGRGETNHKSNRFGNSTDTILFYSKSSENIFNSQFNMDAKGYGEYVEKFYRHVDEKGRRFRIADLSSPNLRPNLMYEYKGYKPPVKGWAISKEKMEEWDKEGRLYFPKDINGRIQRKRFFNELKGKPIQNLWDDIEMITSQSAERLGYPTQKPVALLERIISASSNPGDLILDPFCGCGTTIHAAQKLNRRWIGIDVTHLSIALQKYRLKDAFNLSEKSDYAVIGEPEDIDSALQLASDDRCQFQWWALSLIKAKPIGGQEGSKEGKKGKDTGIDGVIYFFDDNAGKPKRILVQVKSGNVKSGDIRDLRGAVEREGAAMGIFVTLSPPTKDVEQEAVTAGYYFSEGLNRKYPKIQIISIKQLLEGVEIQMPSIGAAFKKAEIESAGVQLNLLKRKIY